MRIFLIGFMGAGKSYLGEMWGEAHSIPFFDLDKLIEEEERTIVENIFATNGEDYFREKEAAILRNTDRFENCIIACGGGTPCYFDNMQWMNKNGVTVFLNEAENDIYDHLRNDKKVRPLVVDQDEDKIKIFIKNKLAARMSFYNKSQIILSSHQLNKDGFAVIEKYINELSK
jgi:shikimate kinase